MQRVRLDGCLEGIYMASQPPLQHLRQQLMMLLLLLLRLMVCAGCRASGSVCNRRVGKPFHSGQVCLHCGNALLELLRQIRHSGRRVV